MTLLDNHDQRATMASAGKPRVILGLMTFGPDVENGGRITDLDTFNKALDIFQARGYDEVDTARIYVGGKQEAFTREADWKSRGLRVATKLWPGLMGVSHKADVLIENFETSLKELGADSVDIFYLHAPDRNVPYTETLSAVNALYTAGKFRQFGLSNFTAFEVAEIVTTCAHHGWVKPTILQAPYNIATRGIEAQLIPACRRYGLDVVVFSPTFGGLFGPHIPLDSKDPQSVVPKEGRFSNNFFGGGLRMAYFNENTFRAAQIVRATSQKAGLDPIEVAFRWLVHHSALNIKSAGGNDGILIGASSLGQLEANLDAVLEKGPLDQNVVLELEGAWDIMKGSAPPYWGVGGPLKYGYELEKEWFGRA
ncbi:putative aflatoxin B1-aldehyde reductase GliO-like protein [Apodospora peruviana]|uniref:Aflatoxin B1-aldehyde reductase GliO-like protein n=1 Tax=Apodospora peruviana TaxID=516989 RepID=A0AAE0ICG7_9PEZI|nr:putative aflatoxin B1-aldehyde reductase GliO-like protein [Apodospora peruviana]